MRADYRRALLAIVLITAGGACVYLAACYRRQDRDPDYDGILDAMERRELLREAAERDAPPEA
jgi:hypothetical protein